MTLRELREAIALLRDADENTQVVIDNDYLWVNKPIETVKFEDGEIVIR